MNMRKARVTVLVSGLAALCCLVLIAGCSGKDSSGRPIAQQSSGELFDHNYEYLLRADGGDFLRLAPNYSTLRPFNVDTAIVVQSRSEHEKISAPAPDDEEYFYIRINRAMALRVVVADSTGLGLIVYDFANMIEGSYTLGSKGWPVDQIEHSKGISWVYVYVVGDQRLRDRRQFRLNTKRHFIPMLPAPGAAN